MGQQPAYEESDVKKRLAAAAGLAAVLIGAAGCGGGSSGSGSSGIGDINGDKSAGTLHVWLQVDAQTGWPDAVKAATDAFHQKFPNVKVAIDYQQWSDHLTKLDAALAGSKPPDVVEMGDTETTSYLASGAFTDLTSSSKDFENSGTWNKGLSASCTYQGKLYCVPYYSGSRTVGYRKDMFQQAGITDTPKTLDELMSDGAKLDAKFGSDPKFSAFYLPGKYWYAAMTFVNDAGGKIATQGSDGKWKGDLESSQSIQGLTNWKDLYSKMSKAPATTDEATPQQYQVVAQGHVAMFYGLGWEIGSVGVTKGGGNAALAAKMGVFALPSASGDGAMQSFAGGSDLAVTAKSQHKNWAAAWTRAFTGSTSEQALIKAGNIPNTTTLLDTAAQSSPTMSAAAASAKNSWMVPITTSWPKVEKANILQNGLADIAAGKVSVADGAKAMDQQITQTLNGG
jgi:N,N'-diacetylchitobiose transport system substrate-binding protein